MRFFHGNGLMITCVNNLLIAVNRRLATFFAEHIPELFYKFFDAAFQSVWSILIEPEITFELFRVRCCMETSKVWGCLRKN
jgi:hypothetical protein